MKQIILFTILSLLFFQGFAQEAKKNVTQTKIIKETSSYNFQLSNYLEYNNDLDKEVIRIFSNLDDTAIIAQLIMSAVGRLGQKKEIIDQHIKDRVIGGVLMLNGTKEEFKTWIQDFEAKNKKL